LPWDQKILSWITRHAEPAALEPSVNPVPLLTTPLSDPREKKKIGVIGMMMMFILVVPVTPLLLLVPHQAWEPILRIPFVQSEIQGVKSLVVEAKTGWFHESPEKAGWNPVQAPRWSGVGVCAKAGPASPMAPARMAACSFDI